METNCQIINVRPRRAGLPQGAFRSEPGVAGTHGHAPMVLAGSGHKPAESAALVQWKENQVGREQLAMKALKATPIPISGLYPQSRSD